MGAPVFIACPFQVGLAITSPAFFVAGFKKKKSKPSNSTALIVVRVVLQHLLEKGRKVKGVRYSLRSCQKHWRHFMKEPMNVKCYASLASLEYSRLGAKCVLEICEEEIL